jgi:uncharacterized protein (TIGR02145 family)
MKNVKLYLATLVFSLVILNGCSEDSISISQEEIIVNSEIQNKPDKPVSDMADKSIVNGQFAYTINDRVQHFAFHAIVDRDGNTTGSWESKSPGQDVRTHGNITCVSFIDDYTAVIGGSITQGYKEEDDITGENIRFKVVDNGEGSKILKDQFADYRISDRGCVDLYFNLHDIAYGNIQIKRKFSRVVDVDGNEYKTIQIGTQIWMAENLRTTAYNDGTPIPNVTGFGDWQGLSTGAYAWYDNDEATNKNLYGALYNGYAVETGKLAPEGWHIPTNEEWEILADYLGGHSVAGGKLKEKGTSNWDTPNTDATNEVGFTALPGGFRDGGFIGLGVNAQWWTSTETSPIEAKYRLVAYDHGALAGLDYLKRNGFSIRCVKD